LFPTQHSEFVINCVGL